MYSLSSNFKSSLIKILAILFMLQALGAIPASFVTKGNAADCSTVGLGISLRSNQVFYFDDGTPITSNYVQFRIAPTGADVSTAGYWAKIESISNPTKLTIAQFETAAHSFNRATVTAAQPLDMYWYLTASGIDTAFSLDVAIYEGNPGVAGVEKCRFTQAFLEIDSTIAANANKVTSVVYSNLPTADPSGAATFTATVKGQTGTIGAGPTDNRDVNLSPATSTTFDANRFRLSGTSYRCGSGTPVLNSLYISNACSGLYTAVFTFQYLSPAASPGASAKLSPIMQIASGTQMKHTSTPSFVVPDIGGIQNPVVTTLPATNIGQTPITSPTSSSATFNGSVDYGTFTEFYYCYKAAPPIPTSFADNCTGGGGVTKSGSATNTGDLVPLDINSLVPGSTYYFELIGVYATPSEGFAHGGIQSFVATPFDTTTAAGSILPTSATLNGTQAGIAEIDVDISNSFFFYGVDVPSAVHVNQSTATRVTLTGAAANTTFSKNVTGLTPNTTYYYEILISDSTGSSYLGGVQRFTTATDNSITWDDQSPTTASSGGSPTYTSGSAVATIPTTAPVKTGYTFGGWYTAPNGAGSSVTNGSYTPLTPFGPITFYAKWTANSDNSITWDDQSPTTASSGGSPTYTSDSAVATIPTTAPVKTGYTFGGWYTAPNGAGSSVTNGSYTPLTPFGPITFYAKWTLIPVVAPQVLYPTITWPNPISKVGPYTLSPIELNAICSVPGSVLTYTPAAGTVLRPGIYELSVTCTPPAGSGYSPLSTIVPFTVLVPASITWPTPSSKIGPYTLTPTELNAVCTILGSTLTYSPALGTSLEPGSYTLTVTCTPPAGSAYSPLTSTVPFTVLPPAVITWPTPLSQPGPYALTPAELNAQCSIPGSVLTYSPPLGSVLERGNRILKVTCEPPAGTLYKAISKTVTFEVTKAIILPPVNPTAKMLSLQSSQIQWNKSADASGYFVTLNGATVCTTANLSCQVKELIGPASDIRIYATRDALTSTFVVPTILKPSKPQVIGIVYFDTAKSKIRPDAAREIKRLAALIKKLGYREIVISGHTDARAFDNLTLSNKRALASKNALAKLVGGLAFDLKYSGAKEPLASNATVSGQQANRRAEIAVW